ncbi:penicillin-binding protein activator LpoP [Stutzerimonas marianensis]
MKRYWMALVAGLVLVQGCASVKRGAIPVVDAGAPVSEEVSSRRAGGSVAAPAAASGTAVQDSEVMVMVPPQSSEPLQTFAAPESVWSGGSVPSPSASEQAAPAQPAPAPRPAPSGIPSTGTLSADEQLDGPVLALLTTAQQQQGGGDLNGAASSLERAQRIAPREPQVLYRLAQVRLAQGDAVQAEQLSRRALGYAAERPALQASLWELIAQARERQGDAAGAAQARERAKVRL